MAYDDSGSIPSIAPCVIGEGPTAVDGGAVGDGSTLPSP